MITYPCLMKSVRSGLEVLFTSDGIGIVQSLDAFYKVGYFSQDWNMKNFKPVVEQYSSLQNGDTDDDI